MQDPNMKGQNLKSGQQAQEKVQLGKDLKLKVQGQD